MTLNSFYFPIFFAMLCLVLLAIQILGRQSDKARRVQVWTLCIFSYIFLAISDWRFAAILFLTTVISYSAARIIGCDKFNDRRLHNRKKIFFTFAIILLVAELGVFKYCNFFIESFAHILRIQAIRLNLILPLGLSFYIFTIIGYLADIYNGKIRAEKNFIDYTLFTSYFPKIISGPIERAENFIPQVKNYGGLSTENFKSGIQIFVFGLFKKIVLADHLSVFVDDVFRAPAAFSSATVLFGILSYSFQIYFDFSGYSDMAIGSSKILGINLQRNFNLPYLARNSSEFWARWHISLSSWLKDYIYIPLGGSRKGHARTYLNLVVVMLASGIWHGAGWTFIIWGLFHAIWSCLGRMIKSVFKENTLCIFNIATTVVNFIFVSLAWVFFRAESISKALLVLKSAFSFQTGISQPYTWTFFAVVILLIATLVAWKKSSKQKENNKNHIEGFYPLLDLSKVWNLTLFFFMVGVTIILGYYGNTAFIYGKF